ncbi:rhomboid family intramembrane serine protease [Corallococcus praedator]|uniref:Rhomboid family intramembrane serine protease n=1 Tax=Corallococcus praedator TaxID=2316724 RepID=A0ABX9QNG6_9BACT|nr:MULTISPECIES: rhomboid family intramembrane serine protease [Corallococcus]RKH08501.1 rhomboid family intramembrane serine protease [Corallococcus sp. CA047B]RKH36250.1 rhomboid family intramembrane serine protease [Corallococcus sp. CA031C]RKI13749.1 rhomboid family intramembrane serine protease [Corallococcus praedator]
MSSPRRTQNELPGPTGLGDEPGPTQGHRDGDGPPPPGPRVALPRPYVCYALMAGAVAMFFLGRSLGQTLVGPDGTPVGHLPPLALFGPAVRAGEYWRLLGMVFEHGNALHLFFNMSVVFTMGQTLERGIGSLRFLALSLVTALGGSAFALFFNFNIVTVGASGMILGWGGAMLPIATQQGRKDLYFWLVQVAVISLLPGVSWAGHLGGFVFGLPCGMALRQGRKFYARAIPVLLFIAAALALVASHPERHGGF